MKVAIHQPNYLPYTGYFQKMAMADIFVLLDTVQYSKDSFTQRVKIRTKDEWIWLTIPVEKSNNFKMIRDVRLPGDSKWKIKHKNSLEANYSKSPFFDKNFIDFYYTLKVDSLRDFNEAGIRYLQEKFNIRTKLVRASDLNINEELASSDLLMEIVKRTGGSTYLSGPSGKQYLDKELFFENNIHIEFFEPDLQEYPQRWPGFQPFMSAIDVVFNVPAEKRREYINTVPAGSLS
ncbi:MAG: WbqC family protein [Methanoregula sp.]|jgi:hypothetical protein|nr:WbqC family protein [Methanoregula sp.]